MRRTEPVRWQVVSEEVGCDEVLVLFPIAYSFSGGVRHAMQRSSWLHFGGAVGGDRHYWHLDRAIAPGGAGGARSSPPLPVHQQHETDRVGGAQLPRFVQGVGPVA